MHQFRTSRRNLLKSATAAAGGALAMPLVARHAMAADTIKVGSLLDLSGPIGSSGQAMHATIQLAVDEANAAGGLLGRQVELVNYDTQSTIQLYSQYAQQLALKDKVAVVHGGITAASRRPRARRSARCSTAIPPCISTTCCTRAACATATASAPAPPRRRRSTSWCPTRWIPGARRRTSSPPTTTTARSPRSGWGSTSVTAAAPCRPPSSSRST